MAFSLQCVNKGCCKINEPYVDPKTDKVFCSACDQEMTNVSRFIVAQMKSNKQYRQKSNTSFAVKCPLCNKEDRPKVVKGELICTGCNKPHKHLSEPFKRMLLEQLKGASKE